MADSSGRGSGLPSAGDPSTPSGPKPKGKQTQGGKMVESRYLQYEKKPTKKAPATDVLKTGGKMPEGGRKPSSLQKSKESSGIFDKGDLQSTLLEGHGTAPPHLDLSAINDKSMLRKTPQLEKKVSKKTESTSFSASQEKDPMENSLAAFEEEAERNLVTMCQEKKQLLKKAHELKRKLLLCQKKRELVDILNPQIEMLSPYAAVSESFKEQYKALAKALDTTRHELPVRSVHLDGGAQKFLDDLQRELTTTHHLLGELGVCSSEENGKVLDLLGELKEMTQKKDLELRRGFLTMGLSSTCSRKNLVFFSFTMLNVLPEMTTIFERSFAQVQELSAGVSKEAALINQEVWEEAQGPVAPRQWYFNEEDTRGDTWGEASSLLLSG